MDAISVAGRFGIIASRAATFRNDRKGTKLNYRVMGDAVSFARRAPSAGAMKACLDEADVCEAIRRDYEDKDRDEDWDEE